MAHLRIAGEVRSGQGPQGGSELLLLQASGDGGHPRLLGRSRASADGRFLFEDVAPAGDGLIYLVANLAGEAPAGGPPLQLAAVVGSPQTATEDLVVNELSTVATAWSLNPFLEGAELSGPQRSLSIGEATYRNLVQADGTVAPRLAAGEQGSRTFLTLSNLLAACISDPSGSCPVLFNHAVNAEGEPAGSTLDALLNLARAPLSVSEPLIALALEDPAYSGGWPPGRTPQAWVLSLVHFAPDAEGRNPLNGPGNIAIGREGQLWVTNNYTPEGDPPFPANTLINLDPGGNLIQPEPLSGGGLYGAGFGIGIDPEGRIWVGNYGFGGENPITDEAALIPLRGNGNSVSAFSPEGEALSPDGPKLPQRVPSGGFTQGDMLGPQGTVSDQEGNIWIASNRETRRQESKVVLYLDGEPENPWNPEPFVHPDLSEPFDIAIDADGDAWVAFTEGGQYGNGGVVELRYDRLTRQYLSRSYLDPDFNGPWAIAVASDGEVWFTNSGGRRGSTVNVIDPESGQIDTFSLSEDELGVWGINLDAAGNAFVNAFKQESIYVVSGKDQLVAGELVRRGELLSPAEGYRIEGTLFRGTGLELDPAGNLWVANNYQTNPRNYGGRNVIEYVGLGAPVDTPLIGPVQAADATAAKESGDAPEDKPVVEVLGLYRLFSADGAVIDRFDSDGDGRSNDTIRPGESGYAEAVVRDLITGRVLNEDDPEPFRVPDGGSWQDRLAAARGAGFATVLLTTRGNDLEVEDVVDRFLSSNPGNLLPAPGDEATSAFAFFGFEAANPRLMA
ncbi:hypothetical protein EVJ50_07315 [Synechococcus sp. RSCCF101]|uniref:Vgb family protein n=1 Tax=Synechococcus sp. RSCCF101 TaxID=2511069 RepID=UPI001248F65B|nr:hypothetical protein [Synechococcus sp. RSCCF101]QEY32071.1 hypothetical protein EVJ50_07315 [Synechococcus sp. RSCCF101]